MTSIASLTKAVDDHGTNAANMFEALMNAKDREHGEIEAEKARRKATREADAKREDEEFDARLQRNRVEKDKILEWNFQMADDIRTLMDGEA